MDVATPASNVDQTRQSNPVNEITGIATRFGDAWATPVYDRAGNMTSIPKPADPTEAFIGSYDAWNRLVQVKDGAAVVSTYRYDGLKRRVTVADNTEIRHAYYSSNWRLLQENVTAGSTTTVDRQFVWGLRYIDELILRDRSFSGGTLNERLFATQDANWNTTTNVDSFGAVSERYHYLPYGTTQFLDGIFAYRSALS